jgi:2-polyprenyl-3-methyl-5-hydroxy-6-metoxy-1,4-benzoquinol methylase
MATSMQPSPRDSHAPAAQPTPTRFFQSLFAYRLSAALKGAVELDLFTAIGEGERTAEAIALRVQGSVRGVRILSDFLTTAGFLEKKGNEYGLTEESAAFLDRRSKMYMGSVALFLAHDDLMKQFSDIAGCVRKGGTMTDQGTIVPNNPLWVEFARDMAPIASMTGEMLYQLLARTGISTKRVLDIAGGHGMYGITIAKHAPHAHVAAVDWHDVLEVAKENAARAGVADRYETIAGSAFEVEFGTGYDLVLLTNFLHHFDAETNESLMRKIHTALAPGGSAVVVDFVPNEDRVTPEEAAGFALTMLATTPSGDAYTHAELDQMFKNSGFRSTELHPLPPTIHQVVIAHRG